MKDDPTQAMASRSLIFLLIGIFLGGSAVELIHWLRPTASAPREPVERERPAFQPPTAEQAYRLQDDCVRRGEAILNGNVIGSALAQDQVSDFNASTNRCYVLLHVHAANLTEMEKYDDSYYLEDGQTKETLAFYRINSNKQKAFLGFDCSDFYCVSEKVADCMKGKHCEPN